jgi:AraC family transcriptional regulator of arabinose operon
MDRIEPNFHIGDDLFSIQYMMRTGSNSMPRPHEHPFFELYYLLNGERVYFMNGNVYTVRKGDLMFIHPHVLHSTASSDKLIFERILVNFSQAFIEEGDFHLTKILQEINSGLMRIPAEEQGEVERILNAMIYECQRAEIHYSSYVRSLLNELLIRLHRISLQTQAQEPEEQHPMFHLVSEIAQYINANYDKKITLEQVAKEFYISPSYLSRIFKRLTGFHFREYILVVRIREAQKRLVNTTDSVQMIAEQTGFGHIAHFNKTFKRLSGTTPLRYRKESQTKIGS